MLCHDVIIGLRKCECVIDYEMCVSKPGSHSGHPADIAKACVAFAEGQGPIPL